MIDFTEKAQIALRYARDIAGEMNSRCVGTEHILAGLLREGTGVAASILKENRVYESRILELMRDTLSNQGDMALMDGSGYSTKAREAIAAAKRFAEECEAEGAGTEHLLLGILCMPDNVAQRLIFACGVDIQKLIKTALRAMGSAEGNVLKKYFRDRSEARNGSQSMLARFGRDMTKDAAMGKLDPVVGRQDEIRRVIQILSRRIKNNPCLVGEPGVGKTAIVEGIAGRMVAGEVPDTLAGKRLITLDLSGMVAGSKYRGEFEERIKKLMEEVIASRDVILFLDEIHTIIGAGNAEGSIDASNILKPALARGEIHLIGATTLTEYRKYFSQDAALERRFQPVTVEEPTMEQTIEILKGVAPRYEEHHGLKISTEALEAAAYLSERYINDRFLPDKAIDLIDEAGAAKRLSEMGLPPALRALEEEVAAMDGAIEAAIRREAFAEAGQIRNEQKKKKARLDKKLMARAKREVTSLVVDENDIARVVSMWTKVPVNKLTEKESERLLKLEDALHKRVIGQEAAVSAVARAVRRGRVGLQDPRRPIGSFLFLGPTGVGKTELSKALAELVFGSDDALIRVDMSEYMEQSSVSKLIGSPPGYVGYDESGQLTEKVRQNPYSVVLFDEIEKAHPEVFNILLQVFDDGHITDSHGRKVSFKNTILIMTSNAGAQRIISPKNLGFTAHTDEKQEYEKMKSGVMEEVRRIMKPEFLNRIDEIIVFEPLNKGDMRRIVTLLCKDLTGRCKTQMGMGLQISASLKDWLIEKHTDLKMGARPLKRAIQSEIEDPLAEEILSGRIGAGDALNVQVKDGKAVFIKREPGKKKSK